MGNYIKPNIIQKFSGLKIDLWNWIEEEIGKKKGPFEIDQGKLAEKFDVSRTAIINALKTFVSANLLKKCGSGRGRGNHCSYQLIWQFKKRPGLKCNPRPNYKDPQEKNLTKAQNTSKTFTKGTKTYRYYAMKFRQAIESSTLADHSQRIVSSIIDHLKGKPVEIAKTWLIYLRNWLDEKHKYLGEFFKYFYDTLQSLARQKLDTARQQEEIEKAIERKAEIRKAYQDSEKPMRKDFKNWEAYGEALERWANSQPEVKTI